MMLKRISDYFTLTSTGFFSAFINPVWAKAFPNTSELDQYFYLRYGERIANKFIESFTVDGELTSSKLVELANLIYSINSKKWDHYFKVYEAEYLPLEDIDITETIHDTSSGESSASSSSSGTTSGTTSGSNSNHENIYGFNTIAENGVKDNNSNGSTSGTTSGSSTGSLENETENSSVYDREYHKKGNNGNTVHSTILNKDLDFWDKWTFIDHICKDICHIVALSVY